MPKTEILLYGEEDGSVPLIQWLDQLPQKVQDKCLVRIERLREMGYELRRPEADYLRKGILSCVSPISGIQYRILYFFHSRQIVLSHGLVKESVVPAREIELAIQRKGKLLKNPSIHIASKTES